MHFCVQSIAGTKYWIGEFDTPNEILTTVEGEILRMIRIGRRDHSIFNNSNLPLL